MKKKTESLLKRIWEEQFEILSPAPQLPLAIEPEQSGIPSIYSRHSATFSNAEWQQLKTLSSQHHVTPTMVLAALFSLGAVSLVWAKSFTAEFNTF